MNPKPETRNLKLISRNDLFLAIGLVILIIGLFLGKSLSGPAFTPATFAHKYYFYGFPVDNLKACEMRYPLQKEEIGEAVRLYEKEDFQALSPILKQLIQAYPADRTFRFYAGLTAHYLKRKNAALAAFIPLSETTGALQQASRWYAALTYVLFNEPESALELLKTIEEGPYADKAKKLIADLT